MGIFSFFSKDKKETLDKGLSKTKESVFSKITKAIAGKSKVDDDVLDNLEEVLITSDVGVDTTLKIIDRIEKRVARDKYVTTQELTTLLRDEIASLLTENNTEDAEGFALPEGKKPYVIMVVGVNGVGKTTTIGKLAYQFKKAGKKVYLGAADTFRAAAVEQLVIWSERVGVPIVKQNMGSDPASVAFDTLSSAKANDADVVIIDTAGRLHIDEDMMDEMVKIRDTVHPDETLLVVDAMTGQDAVTVAKSFNEQIGMDGIIMTKMDGDTRGGAALSAKAVTGKPIKFISSGEKVDADALEPFYPDRMASRILGMGDILTIIDKAEKMFDEKKAAELEQKIRSQKMDLNDFLEQMDAMQNMGDLNDIIKMIPGMNSKKLSGLSVDEKQISRTKAIIHSMTPKERANPEIINYNRKKRIAAGCGLDIADVNRLLKSFDEMNRMMKQLSGGKMKKGKGMNPFGRNFRF